MESPQGPIGNLTDSDESEILKLENKGHFVSEDEWLSIYRYEDGEFVFCNNRLGECYSSAHDAPFQSSDGVVWIPPYCLRFNLQNLKISENKYAVTFVKEYMMNPIFYSKNA